MHTQSTRTLSALAFDRGGEYDPGQPLSSTNARSSSASGHALGVGGAASERPAKDLARRTFVATSIRCLHV
jgi:hypothetical protein